MRKYGNLFVVATPIGNLQDITLRAMETLKEVNLIACEDTRITKRLLDYYNISTKMISYHQHSKAVKINFIVQEIINGKNIALLCDAGTPGVSDPGVKLISEAVKRGIKTIPIPGPATITAILSISGFPCKKFIFMGFMPHKRGRNKFIEQIIDSDCPVIFFESKHRIQKTLNQLKEYPQLHKKSILIGRELSKMHETLYRGDIESLAIPEDEIRGEFAVIINNKTIKSYE